MEFEPSSVVWKSRGKDAVIGTSVVNGREGSKLVLVTTHSEVVEYCTQTRKCVNHWTFRPGSSAALRLAAVRNPVSQAYFGLRAAKKQAAAQGEVLVSWKQSDLDVSKWKHTGLGQNSSAFGLFVHPQLAEDVVVVFENGRFACYDDVLSPVFDSSASDDAIELDGKVQWASLASNHRNPVKGALLLSLLIQSKSDASQYELVLYRIVPAKERRDSRAGASLLARHVLNGTDVKNASVASCAFHAETLSFSVIYTNGEWRMVHFTQDALSHSIEYKSTKKITTFPSDLAVADAVPSAQKKRKLSNAGASSGQIVAGGVGSFSYLVVASTAAPQKLYGWDAKFGVQVATSEVTFDKEGDDSAPLSAPLGANFGPIHSIISSLHGEIVVAAYEFAVFLVNVKNKHSTLASVLGVYSTKDTAADAPSLPNRAVNWAEVAEKKVDVAQWEQSLCSDDAHELQLIAELVSPAAAATSAQFQKKFDAAVTKLTKGGKDLSYRFIVAITHRCVESAETGLWSALKTLIQTKRLSARAIPSLLPVLMKHNQFELLELALVGLVDIDERSVVRLLRYFIRKSDDQALAAYVQTRSKSDASTTSGKRRNSASNAVSSNRELVTPCERFLVALLGLPTNNVFLHHAIRELQLSEVLLLLAVCKKYFYALVQVGAPAPSAPSAQASPSKSGKKTAGTGKDSDDAAASPSFAAMLNGAHFFTALPTATQFCAWTAALIDGHVAQLVLSATKDVKVATALQQLDALVQQQLESCERFEAVENVLSNFLSGVKLPQAHGIPDYSIEELII